MITIAEARVLLVLLDAPNGLRLHDVEGKLEGKVERERVGVILNLFTRRIPTLVYGNKEPDVDYIAYHHVSHETKPDGTYEVYPSPVVKYHITPSGADALRAFYGTHCGHPPSAIVNDTRTNWCSMCEEKENDEAQETTSTT